MNKIVELLIDWDNAEFEELGVDIMSLVDKPAIGISWQAFSEQKFVDPEPGEEHDPFMSRCISVVAKEGYETDQAAAICHSYWEEVHGPTEMETDCTECQQFLRDNPCTAGYVAYGMKPKNGRMVPNCIPIKNAAFESTNDYPEAVKTAAARGIRLNEAVNNKCATQVGKVRAQQLANGENITIDTVRRMYSYLSRAETYYDPKDTEACGTISYLLWGGPAALKWSKRIIEQQEDMSLEPYTDECVDCKQELMFTKEEEEQVLAVAQEVGETIDIEHAVFININQDKFSTISDFLKGVVGLDILGKRGLEQMQGETKFRYAGPPAERNFCKAMQRLNKFYTREEIDQMEQRGLNRVLGHRGQAYSIFDYKGGVNCKHYWEEVELFKDGRETVVIQKGRASGNAGQAAGPQNDFWRYNGSQQFAFSSDEQRIVVGPAMIPEQLIQRKDELGNVFHVFFSKETIQKIAEKFFKEMKHNNTDVNHDDEITKENTLLESWIVKNPEMDQSKTYGFDVPAGTWMTSYKINDDKTWQQIKAGELNGFSVTGDFIQKSIK